MKKVLLIAFMFAFVSFSYAQQKSSSTNSVAKTEKKNNFDEWSKDLNLSAAQQKEIKEIQQKYQERKVAIRQTGTPTDFKKLNAEQDAAVMAVLTPEQRKKAEAYQAKKVKEKEEKAAVKTAVR